MPPMKMEGVKAVSQKYGDEWESLFEEKISAAMDRGYQIIPDTFRTDGVCATILMVKVKVGY